MKRHGGRFDFYQRRAGPRYNSRSELIRGPAVALPKNKPRTFYASVHVTRVEDWCVEAETEEEARALLASGHGERLRIGDCVYCDVARLSE
jgi:hypothetical protein